MRWIVDEADEQRQVLGVTITVSAVRRPGRRLQHDRTLQGRRRHEPDAPAHEPNLDDGRASQRLSSALDLDGAPAHGPQGAHLLPVIRRQQVDDHGTDRVAVGEAIGPTASIEPHSQPEFTQRSRARLEVRLQHVHVGEHVDITGDPRPGDAGQHGVKRNHLTTDE
ncbi:MAG: hypothetical protein ACK5CE_18265 [Actinomycetes bacterium]